MHSKRSSRAWLKSTSDGLLFLDEMRPWRPAASKGDASGESGRVSEAPPGTAPAASFASELDGEDGTPQPHKVLIFSQFHAVLDILESYCNWRGFRTLRLDGGTRRLIRELDMRDFNNPDEDCFVYLIGTRAGGLGINLASANHVVLFDQDWNPHVDSQAVDRSHRIGQRRTVTIYRLVHEWGVEERMVHRQEMKLKMAKYIVDAPSEGDAEDADIVAPGERLSQAEVLSMLCLLYTSPSPRD